MTRQIGRLFYGWQDVSLLQGLVLLVIGGVSAIVGLWVQDTSPPIAPMSVTPVQSIVAPGETLRIRYDVERYRSCASRIDRILLDSDKIRFTLEDLDYAAAPGPLGRDTFITDVPIPRGFSQGPAVYRVITRYECNLLHRVWPIVLMRDIPFEVRGPAPIEALPIPIEPVPRG